MSVVEVTVVYKRQSARILMKYDADQRTVVVEVVSMQEHAGPIFPSCLSLEEQAAHEWAEFAAARRSSGDLFETMVAITVVVVVDVEVVVGVEV